MWRSWRELAMHTLFSTKQSKGTHRVNREPSEGNSSRRKFIAVLLGTVTSLWLGSSAKATTKKPMKKRITKPSPKPSVKATPKVSSKPTQMPSSTPSASPKPTARPTTSPSAESTVIQTDKNPKIPRNGQQISVNGQILKVDSIAIGGTAIGVRIEPFVRNTVFVTRTGQRSFVAFDSVCTHRGGALALKGEVLVCNLHAAQFDARSGAVLHPPATVPLTPGDIEIVDEILYWIPLDQ